MLNQLRNLDLDAHGLDEMISLQAHGDAMANLYNHYGADMPEWLTRNRAALEREIRRATADELDRKIANARARVESYKSQKQKREDAAAELAQLEKLKAAQ